MASSKGPYLQFIVQQSAGKTKQWEVSNISSGQVLGVVFWFSAWRRYVWQPTISCVMDAQCLDEIVGFLQKETAEQKLTWKGNQ